MRLYPGSEWARLIEDPEFLDAEEMVREAQREEYEAMLGRYYRRDYQNVLLDVDEVLERDSANHFECKYKLLRAQCVGGLTSYSQGTAPPTTTHCKALLPECPETEESAWAKDMMRKFGVELGSEATTKDEEAEEAPGESRRLTPIPTRNITSPFSFRWAAEAGKTSRQKHQISTMHFTPQSA